MAVRNRLIACFVFSIALVLVQRAAAQEDFLRYQQQLLRMAEILGGVHHLRGTCDDSESQYWRGRMLRLIDIEQPSQSLRNQMIERFNNNYDEQKRRFPECGNKTADEAARLAREGESLASQMARELSD